MTTTSTFPLRARAGKSERIDVTYDYAVCSWARHFNVSEKRVKEAVAAVGNESERVREHLQRTRPSSERPASH
jgi:predicted nucleotidyltransferase